MKFLAVTEIYLKIAVYFEINSIIFLPCVWRRNPKKRTYCIEEGVLYKVMKTEISEGELLYILSSIKKKLLTIHHDSSWAAHFGFWKTY